MSQTKYLEFTCPNCNKLGNGNFYTSINTNEPEAIHLILEDKINRVNCKNCDFQFTIIKSFLFNNIKKGYALYYNPIDLKSIDKSNESIKKILGEDHYMLNPIKFSNWKDFQNELYKREMSTLVK